MQTSNETDPANVRWENKDAQGVYVKICEEQSRDSETFHTAETVGFMAFSVQQTSFCQFAALITNFVIKAESSYSAFFRYLWPFEVYIINILSKGF